MVQQMGDVNGALSVYSDGRGLEPFVVPVDRRSSERMFSDLTVAEKEIRTGSRGEAVASL